MRGALLILCVTACVTAQTRRFPPLAPAPPAERSEGPTVTHKVDPVYTSDARDAKVEGAVTLYAEIGLDGRAHKIRVVKSLGHGLDEAAIAAVRKWEFLPAVRFGRRVAAPATIDVPFLLDENLPVLV